MPLLIKSLLAGIAMAGLGLVGAVTHAQQDTARIAAAASLRAVMDELVATYRAENPSARVEAVYGSSGSLRAQIENGAPFDLFFSADMAYPQALKDAGLAEGEVVAYSFGRLVLWTPREDASKLELETLTEDRFRRIAIANPRHAPYGARAAEALHALQLWEPLESRLVFGENIGQALQMVHSGGADIGILARAQMYARTMQGQPYRLIDASLHEPLENGFIVTRRGRDNATARDFADFMSGDAARQTLRAYGFSTPSAE